MGSMTTLISPLTDSAFWAREAVSRPNAPNENAPMALIRKIDIPETDDPHVKGNDAKTQQQDELQQGQQQPAARQRQKKIAASQHPAKELIPQGDRCDLSASGAEFTIRIYTKQYYNPLRTKQLGGNGLSTVVHFLSLPEARFAMVYF